METAFLYLISNSTKIISNIHVNQHNFIISVINMNNLSRAQYLTLPTYISLISTTLKNTYCQFSDIR